MGQHRVSKVGEQRGQWRGSDSDNAGVAGAGEGMQRSRGVCGLAPECSPSKWAPVISSLARLSFESKCERERYKFPFLRSSLAVRWLRL